MKQLFSTRMSGLRRTLLIGAGATVLVATAGIAPSYADNQWGSPHVVVRPSDNQWGGPHVLVRPNDNQWGGQPH